MDLIGENELYSIIETRFLRSRFRVDTGDTIIEVSIDKGEIITVKGEEPILEMELEMFSGNEEELVKIGEELSYICAFLLRFDSNINSTEFELFFPVYGDNILPITIICIASFALMGIYTSTVSYTHLRAHETRHDL